LLLRKYVMSEGGGANPVNGSLTTMDKKDKNMASGENTNDIEKRKIELIRLRIKNRYYEKEDVLEKVVEEIIQKNIHPTH